MRATTSHTCLKSAKLTEKGRKSSHTQIFVEVLTANIGLTLYLHRIVINPEKRPYNMSEVILWTLDDGNTVNRLEMENDNEECYYFERLERVLATQVTGMMQNLLLTDDKKNSILT